MGKARHKKQNANLKVTTTLAPQDVAELAKQAADGIKSSIPGQPFIRFDGGGLDVLDFSIRSLGGHVELMTFEVRMTADDAGKTQVITQIGNFKTTQPTYLFIPVGPKSLVGYREYRRFALALRAAIETKDPDATLVYTEVA